MTINENDVSLILSAPKRYSQKTSIQHWQLRDLITYPTQDRREILAIHQNNVCLFNTARKTVSHPLKELSFSPTSVACDHGYLAVGGQRSQVVVRQLNSNWMAQTSIGNAINNAMHISQHQLEVRLSVCNNDETVKIFSLPNLEHITSVNLHVAVNGLSVSPDGSKMVAVGDTNQAFLYSIQGTSYRLVAALPTVNDAGFSCSWDTASEKFAVACQDGYACVWDVRSLNKKLALLESTQRSQKGAVRCVKFSRSNSMDLLAFSEHVSVVNVVDARTFSLRQTIRIAPSNTDLHISGLAFSPDSKSLTVGLEQQLLEFDVDTASRRSFAVGKVV